MRMIYDPSQATLFEDIDNSISLQESEDSPLECEWQDSPKMSVLSQGDSRANRIQWRGSAKDQGTNVTYGPNSTALFATLDPNGCWLRTSEDYCQVTMDGSLEEYSETWPTSGTMQSGKCYPQVPLVRHMNVNVYLSLPTPATRDYRDLSSDGQAYAAQRSRHQPSLVTESYLADFGTKHILAIYIWAMGYPPRWCDTG